MSTNDIHQDASNPGDSSQNAVRTKLRFYRRIIAFLFFFLACSLVSAPFFYHLYQSTLGEYEDLYASHISLQDDLATLQEEHDSLVAGLSTVTPEVESSTLSDYTEGENTVVVDGENFKTFYTVDRINLRKGPGIDFESMALIPAGTRLSVDTNSGNLWKKTYYNGNYGYVSSDYLSEDTVSYNYEDDASDSSDDSTGSRHQMWATATIALRSNPSATYTKVGTLYKGNPITVFSYDANDEWCTVEREGGGIAYIPREYLSFSPTVAMSSDDYLSEDDYSYDDHQEYDSSNNQEDGYEDNTSYDPLVWISATGEKYHSKPDCGRMNPNRAYQMTLSEAQASGYGACQKCF